MTLGNGKEMEKNRYGVLRHKLCGGCLLALFAILLGWGMNLTVRAGGFYENSHVVFSPDRGAWTIPEALPSAEDASNRVNPSCWYPTGEICKTGIPLDIKQPGVMEHAYFYERTGLTQVTRWQVVFSSAKCIHPDFGSFHGMQYSGTRCLSSYYSGWYPFCADCGERIETGYVYMSRDYIRTLQEIDLGLDYYYNCPTCGHLEQGRGVRHLCRAVSPNRYRVVYQPNAGDATGYMQPSFHMCNNAEVFEGEPVTPVKKLSINCYRRVGYHFAGWNTRPDGSGTAFSDGQEILNLTEENYDPGQETGTIILYAQWKNVRGSLIIDPGKGKYQGKAGLSTIEMKYGGKYRARGEDLTAPQGYLVSFDTMGGEKLEAVRGRNLFLSWRLEQPMVGTLQGEEYWFWGEDGTSDRLTAIYQPEGILLPQPEKAGYSFGGWYLDPACKAQAGNAGDHYVPSGDVTLYACWVELVLTAELNWNANEGRGAVDLRWAQPDGKNKVYLLYQKREQESFHRIHSAAETTKQPELETVAYSGKDEYYTVPATGFYQLTANGAQGQNYEEFLGGLGGSAEGTFYLEKGDRLTIRVGGQNGYGGGGKSTEYGQGGGRTMITSDKLGLLVIGGGGGGASKSGAGGDGGLENGILDDISGTGQDGQGGGGGGYRGGMAGVYQVHVHDPSCLHQHLGNGNTGGDCYVETTDTRECEVVVRGPDRDTARSNDCVPCILAGRNGYGSMYLYVWRLIHHGCGEPDDFSTHCWWQCSVCGLIGYRSGTGEGGPGGYRHSYVVKGYELNCERVYDCEKEYGTVTASYGGSSYVNKEATVAYKLTQGKQKWDGYVWIRPVSVGFQENLELKAVSAPDLKAPERIREDGVRMEAVGENRVRILFEEPEDQGTIYYHKAESFFAGTREVLSVSNVTATEVVSGVAGYYYRLDNSPNTAVTLENADNQERILRESQISVDVTKSQGYLHIAPVDRAGNVGESITVSLSGDLSVAWKLHTEQMNISSLIETREYGSVAPAGEGVYFVRANGRTPFVLDFLGEMDGMPRKNYKIDRMSFVFSLADLGAEGTYTIRLPQSSIEQEEEMNADAFECLTQGNGILQAALYGKAQRMEAGKKVKICQSFTLDGSFHGRQIYVIPVAGAAFQEEVVLSDREEDFTHKITLIGDGEAPVVHGLEQTDKLLAGNRREEKELMLDLTAEDALSGVAAFSAVLCNLDNSGEISYFPDADGHIRIQLPQDSPMLSGDLKLTVCTRDRVGNESTLEYGAAEFGLRAEIVRILSPHDPAFKKGESGILIITAWGYAERIEVEFPEEFTLWEETLNRVYEYTVPQEMVREEQEFMVPLYVPDQEEYSVVVRAYKGDSFLEEHPVFCTLAVTDTVLGELRTRLR